MATSVRRSTRRGSPRASTRAQKLADFNAAEEAAVKAAATPVAEEQPDTSWIQPPTEIHIEGPEIPEPVLEQPLVVPEGDLAAIANEINKRFALSTRLDQQSHDHTLAAALKLAEAKAICEARKLNFRKWAESSTTQTYQTVRKLAAIGATPNPEEALNDYRSRHRARNAAYRNRLTGAAQAAARISHSPEEAAGNAMAPSSTEPPVLADEKPGVDLRTMNTPPPNIYAKLDEIMIRVADLQNQDKIWVAEQALKVVAQDISHEAARAAADRALV